MAAVECSVLDFFPENIMIDILSYLTPRELVRNSRVCKRWQRLVKDQRLWSSVSSRVLWSLLRRFLGRSLVCLHLRGLLVCVRRGVFLTEAWLHALSSRCSWIHTLRLTHTDLRGLHVIMLPQTLRTLELKHCEISAGFFMAQAKQAPPSLHALGLHSVPSITDLHLLSLHSVFPELVVLDLGDLLRVTALGLQRAFATRRSGTLQEAGSGLRELHLMARGRSRRLAPALAQGWVGLQTLVLAGEEVHLGLKSVGRLSELHTLRLRACSISLHTLTTCLRSAPHLRTLEFTDVQVVEDEKERTERTQMSEREGEARSTEDPELRVRQVVCTLLPECSVSFTRTHTGPELKTTD
ncbi:hypothetical protein DNTS_000578 [Danionella cerebrum]|uniref:F-box domain-containing protein n=1 Tax=Danionella cerebrum TaxID=2873325 RepID=A0A553Q039_9TELE|nr:hypothetical protein DNTS_000578 [Danionella translucida]